MSPPRTLVVAVAAACLTLSACGGGTSMTTGAANELSARVEEVRAAASSGDRAAADAALAELRTAVANLRHNGSISDDKANSILAAASVVEVRLDLMPTTTLPKGKGHDKGNHGGGGD